MMPHWMNLLVELRNSPGQMEQLKDLLMYVYHTHTCTGEPLYCRHHWDPSNCPDCRDVLFIQLGQTKVSIFEGCPYFRGDRIEGFHCTYNVYVYVCMFATYMYM